MKQQRHVGRSAPELRWSDIDSAAPRTRWTSLAGADRVRFAYSGRAALYQYLLRLRQSLAGAPERRTVLVPAFHCPTVVDPVLHAGFDVQFYSIDQELNVVESDLLRKLDQRVASVIFINYFGLRDAPPSLAAACRDSGARVVHDCSHSFLSANPIQLAGSGADATTYSFWKLVPCLAGGGVLIGGAEPSTDWPEQTRPSAGDSLFRMRSLAGQAMQREIHGFRGIFKLRSPESPFVEPVAPVVRRTAAEAYPYVESVSNWRMPTTAKVILRRIDLQSVSDARRRNYAALANTLQVRREVRPIAGQLPENACPWGFPVVLQQRSARDYKIRARGVPLFTFGEVLHPLLFDAKFRQQTGMLEMARFLSDNVLAFAIHQNLTECQVRHSGELINESLDDMATEFS